MSIPVHCKACGYRGVARSIHIENSTGLSIQGGEDCPKCGGMAKFQSGTYDFVGVVMTAFRQVSRENIENFRDIAQAVKAGNATKAEAEKQIQELGLSLARVWDWTNSNSGGLAVLIAILTLYLQISAGWSADHTAEKLQASVEKQTQVEQMMLAELQKHPEAAAAQAARPIPSLKLQPPYLPHRQAMGPQPNRHQRRAAKARERRH